jgi:hypothetical protein
VHATFTAHGSRITKAPIKSRLDYFQTKGMCFPMTGWMNQSAITENIRTANDASNDVVIVPSGIDIHLVPAWGTQTLLIAI